MIDIVCSNAREKDGGVAKRLQQILFGSDSETQKLFKNYLKETFPVTQNGAEESRENLPKSRASTSKKKAVVSNVTSSNKSSPTHTEDNWDTESASVRSHLAAPVESAEVRSNSPEKDDATEDQCNDEVQLVVQNSNEAVAGKGKGKGPVAPTPSAH